MARNITKRQAQQALRQVRQQFTAYIDSDADGPKLIKDWDYLESGPTTWAIVWEGGPYYWALLAQHGGTGEHGETIPAAQRWPANVFVEAATSWAIGLYPEYA